MFIPISSSPPSNVLICWDLEKKQNAELPYTKKRYENPKSFYKNDYYINYKVFDQGKKVGVASVHFKDSKTCSIMSLKNKSNEKYTGIGSQLIKKIVKRALKKDLTSLKLDAAETSHLFYVKMGFRPTPSWQLVVSPQYEEQFIFIQKELESKKFYDVYNEHIDDDTPCLVEVLKLIDQEFINLGISKKKLIANRCHYFPQLCVTKSSLICKEMKRLLKQEQDTGQTPTSFHLRIFGMDLPSQSLDIWSNIFKENDEDAKRQLFSLLRDVPFPE